MKDFLQVFVDSHSGAGVCSGCSTTVNVRLTDLRKARIKDFPSQDRSDGGIYHLLHPRFTISKSDRWTTSLPERLDEPNE
jgi:hypothetical protein